MQQGVIKYADRSRKINFLHLLKTDGGGEVFHRSFDLTQQALQSGSRHLQNSGFGPVDAAILFHPFFRIGGNFIQ